MKARHEAEIKAVSGGGTEEVGVTIHTNTRNNSISNGNDDKNESSTLLSPEQVAVAAEEQRQRQIREKLGLKREKAREKERAKEQAIAEETANAGPAPRDVEMQVIQSKLPQDYQMEEVAADGHCLYRAVAAHSELTYSKIRTSGYGLIILIRSLVVYSSKVSHYLAHVCILIFLWQATCARTS
jgi:hypothetical protein